MGKKARLEKKKEDKVLQRKPAQEMLLEFIKLYSIVLIVDEVETTRTDVPGALYTVVRSPRVRVYYKDQIKEETKPPTNG